MQADLDITFFVGRNRESKNRMMTDEMNKRKTLSIFIETCRGSIVTEKCKKILREIIKMNLCYCYKQEKKTFRHACLLPAIDRQNNRAKSIQN